MGAGDTLLAGDLPIPDEVRLVTAPEEVVAVIVAPRRTVADEAAGAEGETEGEAQAEQVPDNQ